MLDFYVHIIESPSPKDLVEGRTEGKLILEFLKLANIDCEYDLTVSNYEFWNSIENRVGEATVRYKKYPILHFSSHGNEDGLQLTDDTQISWNKLKQICTIFTRTLKGNFVLSFSSCQGFSACKMAMGINGRIPFGALVGPLDDIPWDESAVAFMVFYNRLKKDGNAYKALDAMNAASGAKAEFKWKTKKFNTITGVDAQKLFRRELEKILFQKIQKELQNLKIKNSP